MRHLLKWLLLMSLLCYLSACSEQEEIEERGFVVGVAYDLVKEKRSNPIMQGTYQIVLPSKLTPQNGQQGGSDKSYINVSAKSDSAFEQFRIIAKKISRTMFFPHIQVLVLSEDLLKKPNVLQNILDVYFRDHEMRRNIRLFISKDKAGDILNQSAKPENLPAKYIDMLTEHTGKNAQMVEATRIGEVQEKMIAKRSFVLPVLTLTKQGVQMSGAALFRGKDNQFVGRLSGENTLGLNYIIGKKVAGLFTVRKENQLVTYEIHKVNRKVKMSAGDAKAPKFRIDLFIEGTLAELHFSEKNQVMGEKKLKQFIAKEMEKHIQKTVKMIQKEYKVDVLELGEIYKRRDYKAWSKVNKNWDQGENYFSKCEVVVHVHPAIDHSGSSLPKKVQ
ncbi:Ger(x)C family spore germination protein [Bacillus sp. C1]